MTSEQFWDKYINENILEIFDDACAFFSKELPEGFTEEYDVGEIILEVSGHQESEKNFDNFVMFLDILKKHQFPLYQENFPYFEDSLIDYFYVCKNKARVFESFALFIENPLQDAAKYFAVFNKIMFWQYTELLNEAIEKNFVTINESDKLLDGVAKDLVFPKLYIELQDIFEKGIKTIDKADFSAKLTNYDLNLSDSLVFYIEMGVLKPQLGIEEIDILFKKDKMAFMVLEGYFLRYMYAKGFSFYLSAFIFGGLLSYWQKHNRTKKINESYFQIRSTTFEEHFSFSDSFFFIDNSPEIITKLWGSVYVYEFLYENKFISKKLFEDFIKISKKLKGETIADYFPSLWKSVFVHTWEKPACISETEFLEESKIFQKTLTIKYSEDLDNIQSLIGDELSKIGEMADFIREGNEKQLKEKQRIRSHWNTEDANIFADNQPIRVEAKIGRNEPCSCGSGKKYKKCCGK